MRVRADCVGVDAGQPAHSNPDLHVSEGLAERRIAISGAFAVVTSLIVSALTGTMNRKWLLLIGAFGIGRRTMSSRLDTQEDA